MSTNVTTDTTKWQVHDFLGKIGSKSLNLRPDFQRFYIWDSAKERAFIDTNGAIAHRACNQSAGSRRDP